MAITGYWFWARFGTSNWKVTMPLGLAVSVSTSAPLKSNCTLSPGAKFEPVPWTEVSAGPCCGFSVKPADGVAVAVGDWVEVGLGATVGVEVAVDVRVGRGVAVGDAVCAKAVWLRPIRPTTTSVSETAIRQEGPTIRPDRWVGSR
jgi:hypothetical protein